MRKARTNRLSSRSAVSAVRDSAPRTAEPSMRSRAESTATRKANASRRLPLIQIRYSGDGVARAEMPDGSVEMFFPDSGTVPIRTLVAVD